MAYSSGMMDKRITFAKRKASETGRSGRDSGGIKYEIVCTVWAAEDFNKGVKALRNGAVEAYDVVMFRLRWRDDINRWCIVQYNGVWYEIMSFNGSYRDNQIQITARELPNQKVTIAAES